MYHVRIGKQQLAMAPLRRRSKQVLNRRGALIARCRHTPLEIAGGAEAALAKAALEARRHRDIGSRRRRDPAAPVAALRKGTIAGAGLYVYEGGSAVSPELIAMKNVVLCDRLGQMRTRRLT